MTDAVSSSIIQPVTSRPLVGIAVLNYCSAEQTVRCVQAIEQLRYQPRETIVVDNDSPDDSPRMLREQLPQVEVIASGENRGYGYGNNVAIRRLLDRGAQLVWIVTPDVIVEPDTLDPLVEVMWQEPKIGIVGPVMHAGGQCIRQSLVLRHLGFLAVHRVCGEDEARALPPCNDTHYVDGGAILLRREMIEQIGLLREDFFLYYDETEYCLRARDLGWRVVIVGQSHVFTRALQEERPAHDFYMCRNSILLARLRREHRTITVARQAWAMFWQLVSAPWGHKCERVQLFARAIREGLSRHVEESPRWTGVPRS